ncbi:MAG TPA: polyprenyl diphosphate synthase [Spirochaetia bacterium]|nr:polyprenyl diphosphate synthase [Spirochaetia bacterium]
MERPLPAHVGIIMDGNGRWAQARGLPRSEGHREGTENAKRVVRAASELGLRYLSLFVFSTENWKRTEEEVGFLMSLIRRHLAAELDFYRANRVRVLHSGDLGGLPPDVAAEIERTMADTASFGGLTVNLAINYGGRDEIARAARRVSASGRPIDEASLSAAMDRPELPDLDLVIRTSDEMRFSNFLLWQAAYAELWFSPKLWPDFGPEDLAEAIGAYRRRERRFGGRS